MDYQDFRRSLRDARPPRGLPALLKALWHDAKGDWNRAHAIAAGERSTAAARVHAYLHRKEGDSDNASYWYTRAGAERPHASPRKEWEALVRSFFDAE
jgi:hypothetical protein